MAKFSLHLKPFVCATMADLHWHTSSRRRRRSEQLLDGGTADGLLLMLSSLYVNLLPVRVLLLDVPVESNITLQENILPLRRPLNLLLDKVQAN